MNDDGRTDSRTDGRQRGRGRLSVGPSVRLSVALLLAAVPALAQRAPAPRDSVRQLRVAIVLATSSFAKTLTRQDIERVHEEVAEFYAFYQQHGAGKVDFEFSLVQVDRRMARGEISEVAPSRYYLARENLEHELAARGFQGRFDEVVALHAWSNANADRALQAYGGGAVGPDGRFLGDAGFNSIPSMGRDPNTIGQVLIHEVLHNIDDMFSRSGMADDFLNSDEMSRNMAQLLRERPGAFLPLYSDADMLAYAERERQGREAYPWAMQLVYYGWMLERTPKASWDQLRYGRMVRLAAPAVRPLYSTIYTPAGNDSTYVVELGRSRLPERNFVQADFDGTPIYRGAFGAAWLAVPGGDSGAVASSQVVRQRVASIEIEPEIVHYLDEPRGSLGARVVQDRCCRPALELPEADVVFDDHVAGAAGGGTVTVRGARSGWYVHPAVTHLVVRRSWSVADDGPLTVATGAPVTLNALVREDRAVNDATVRAVLHGREIPLTRSGDGRYTATLEDELPFGLHTARIEARRADGTTVTDSARVYIRPGGWIRVPGEYAREPDGAVRVTASMHTRMGRTLLQPLPLVAIVGDAATPLLFGELSAYSATVRAPASVNRLVVTSLLGDPQRRVVRLVPGPATYPSRRGVTPFRDSVPLPVFATAVRLERSPHVDGDPADWPATAAPPLRLSERNHLLTDSAHYHGARDLSGSLRFGWDDSTLYVAGELVDDSVTTGEAWDVDRVNLVFDMKDDTSPVTYATANPPLDQWQDDDYWLFWRSGGTTVRRFGKVFADPVPGARLATRRTAAGWSFEVAIPRAQLPGYAPFAGQVAGLQVFVTDGDGEPTATELMWAARWPYSSEGIEWRLAELALLLFVDAPIR